MKRSPMPPRKVPMKSNGFTRAERIEQREVAKLMVKAKKLRLRKCTIKSCRKPFEPRSMTHKVCGPECAQELAQLERQKAERKADKEKLAKFKRKADHVADCQKAFNAWVRFRDRNLPCICCGRRASSTSLTGGAWDAGHYLSRGSHPHLRFDERNVFAQLKGCNRPGGTTAASFRAGVISRIGLAAVEALEADHEPRHYTVDELIALTAHYKQKLKELKAAA